MQVLRVQTVTQIANLYEHVLYVGHRDQSRGGLELFLSCTQEQIWHKAIQLYFQWCYDAVTQVLMFVHPETQVLNTRIPEPKIKLAQPVAYGPHEARDSFESGST